MSREIQTRLLTGHALLVDPQVVGLVVSIGDAAWDPVRHEVSQADVDRAMRGEKVYVGGGRLTIVPAQESWEERDARLRRTVQPSPMYVEPEVARAFAKAAEPKGKG